MKRISTHILDLMRGQPANNVSVRLERQEASGSWRMLNSVRTDGESQFHIPLLLSANGYTTYRGS